MLAHRLRRGAEMQNPATNILGFARPGAGSCTSISTRTSTGISVPSWLSLKAGWHRMGTSCPRSLQADEGSRHRAGSANSLREWDRAGRGQWGRAEASLHASTPQSCRESQELLKKDPASPFHFPAENIWSAWHLCCSE